MQLLPPWQSVVDDAESEALGDELRRELRRGHDLFAAPVRAIARRLDRDDVLFAIEDGSGRVAVVHLTWAGRERPPWPDTDIYASLPDWIEERMRADHDEYDA